MEKLNTKLTKLLQLYSQNKPKLLSIFMLLFSILFSFLLYSPLLNEGRNNAGDNFYHTTNMIYLKELIEGGQNVFGWFHIFGTGQPLLSLYQSMYYFIVIALHYLTFKTLSIIALDKIVLVFLTSLYPLPIYYFLRKLRFNYMVCGLGSMLSMVSNAGWGNNITLYAYSGAITASVSMFFAPLALGSVYNALSKRGSMILPVFLSVLAILGHFLLGYELIFIIIAEIIILYMCCGLDPSQIKKISIFFALVILLISFILLPLVTLNNARSFSEYRKEGGYLGSRISFTAQKFIDSYAKGEFFDKTGPDLPMYNWFNNFGYPRYPILTIFSVVGFVSTFFWLKKFKYSFLNIGFMVAILFLLGVDEVLPLKFLPLIQDFHSLRASIYVEFFAICLSAIGIYYTIHLIKKFFASMAHAKFGNINQNVLSFLPILIIALIFINPYFERVKVANVLVDTIDDFRWKELEALSNLFERSYKGGRIFVGDESGVTHEPTKVVAAGVFKKPVLTNPNWEQYLAIINFEELWYYRYNPSNASMTFPFKKKFTDLLNVKYILFSNNKAHSPEFNQAKDRFKELVSSKSFSLHEIKTNSSYAETVELKPILAIVSDSEWYFLSLSWTRNFRDRWKDDETIFFIKPKEAALDDININASLYPTILLSSYEIGDHAKVMLKLRKYVEDGGIIISKDPLQIDYAIILRNDSKVRLDISTERFNGNYILTEYQEGLSKFSYKFSSENPRFLVFKMSYFPGWEAKVDGKKAEIFSVSPGFFGFWVPEGNHDIEVSYSSLITQKVGIFISLITLVCMLIYIFYRPRFKIKESPGKRFAPAAALRKYLPHIASFLLLVYILSLYYAQNYSLIPSKISPDFLETYNPNNVHLRWNRIDNVPQQYEIQVSKSRLDFEDNIIYDEFSGEDSKDAPALEPCAKYYWKVKLVNKEKQTKWSGISSFYTNNDMPLMDEIKIKVKK